MRRDVLTVMTGTICYYPTYSKLRAACSFINTDDAVVVIIDT